VSKFNLLKKLFPNANTIFAKETSSLEKALKNGIIVLDTNTLLFPFNVNKQKLNEIVLVYKKINTENRLYIPGHVAREFAKNRASRLGDIYSSVSKMSDSQRELKRYPILSDIHEYQELVELQKSVAETEKQIREKVKSVLAIIARFERNDPVSVAYSDIFKNEVIYEYAASDKELEDDFKYRTENSIPPGYKDAGKSVNAEGDIIIWNTILEIGRQFKKDLVFISSDGKPDWQNNVDKKPFQPRYELIDEYQRASDGKSFHIAPLSQLLEIFEASEETVQRVEWLEHTKQDKNSYTASLSSESVDSKIEEMKNWFLSNYEPPEHSLPYESRKGGYFYIWGGPYNIEDVLFEEYGLTVSEHLIRLCIEYIEEEYGDIEWSAVPDNESIWVSVHPDYETCDDVGASGMFQVISVEDENGRNLSKFIDCGKHYSSLKDVLKDLKGALGVNVDGELV
jgi:hypothetical protein